VNHEAVERASRRQLLHASSRHVGAESLDANRSYTDYYRGPFNHLLHRKNKRAQGNDVSSEDVHVDMGVIDCGRRRGV